MDNVIILLLLVLMGFYFVYFVCYFGQTSSTVSEWEKDKAFYLYMMYMEMSESDKMRVNNFISDYELKQKLSRKVRTSCADEIYKIFVKANLSFEEVGNLKVYEELNKFENFNETHHLSSSIVVKSSKLNRTMSNNMTLNSEKKSNNLW